MKSYEQDGILVIQPSGYLDVGFKKEVIQLADTQIKAGIRTVLFNMCKAELINSYGIAGLLTVYDELSQYKGILAFSDVHALMVINALKICGLSNFCAPHIYDTEAEALLGLHAE